MPAQAVLATLLASFAVLCVLLSPAGRRLMLDRPNERSLHAQPVPRSGGLAIVAGVAAAAALYPSSYVMMVTLLLAGGLAVVSLLDDFMNLPTLLRLAAHLGASAALLGFASDVGDNLALFLLLTLALAWSANLYNFMDGADGLAGGMALFGFGAYAVAAQLADVPALSMLSASIALAAAVFLLANFPPARIFMGDVGSVPLGFLAGGLGVLGWLAGAWPLWFPMLVFAPFACDATLTLLRRVLRRERVWQAHRDHYYQRLVRMGWGHRGTLRIEYGVMAVCALVALAARTASGMVQLCAVGAVALALVALAAWIDARWARELAAGKVAL